MSQLQFEMIVRVLKAGAPALSRELCEALVNLVESEATLKLKVEELQKQIDANACVRTNVESEKK